MSRTKTRAGAGAFLLGFLFVASSASAQPAPAPAQPAPAPAPAQPAPAEPQSGDMAEAKRQFEAGVSLLEDPDGAKYEQAHRAFQRAHELSKSPKVLGNIAFCAMHLERDGEAIDAYSAYLRDVPDISDRERTQIQRDVATLSATTARVNVVVKQPTDAFVLVDHRTPTRGEPIDNTYNVKGSQVALRVRPGRHTFKVRLPDGTESRPSEVTIEPGGSTTVEIAFSAPEAPVAATPARPVDKPSGGSPSLVGPIVLGAAGIVALGIGTATGLAARGKADDIESNCQNDVCPAAYDLEGERSSATTLGTVADVSFVGGGLLLGGAVLWYLLQPKDTAPSAGATARTAWLPGGMCTATGCGFQLKRGF